MPLSIDEIAQNLIAQHRLLLRVGPILENIFPGLEVSKIEVRLKTLESSSLREEFLLALVLAYQEDVERSVIEFVEEIFGRDVPEPYEWVVTLLVLLATLSAAQHVYRRVFPQKEPDALKKDYRTILNITAEQMHITSTQLDEAMGKAITPRERRNLTRSVANFFRPAQKGADSRIEAGETPGISKEAVAEFPHEIDLEDVKESPKIPYSNTLLDIRAIDRDKSETGWAARVPEIEDVRKRLPMRLYPTISPSMLAKHETLRGDIVLEYIIGMRRMS